MRELYRGLTAGDKTKIFGTGELATFFTPSALYSVQGLILCLLRLYVIDAKKVSINKMEITFLRLGFSDYD